MRGTEVACASASPSPLELLLAACRNGDTQHVLGLLRQRASASHLNEAGNGGGDTAVIAACRFGHHELAIALLQLGANVNVPKENGGTSLHVAAQNGHKDVVTELIAHRANVEAAAVNGSTPLYIAAQNGHVETVALLLEQLNVTPSRNGVGTSNQLIESRTELLHIADTRFPGGVSKLEVTDAQGSTPLIAAVRSGHFDVAKLLISKGASVNARF